MDDPARKDLQAEVQSLTLQNKALSDQVHSLTQFLRTLEFVSEAKNSDDDDHEHLSWWLKNTLNQTLKLMNAPQGSVLWLDPQTQELEFVLVEGVDHQDLVGTRLQMGEGVAGWVAQNRQAVIVEDANRDPRFSSRIDRELQFKTHTIIAAPIMGGRGQVLGVVEAINQGGDAHFEAIHATMLTLFCDFVGDALQNLKAE